MAGKRGWPLLMLRPLTTMVNGCHSAQHLAPVIIIAAINSGRRWNAATAASE
jgi:hypothetical protein